ncbi:MAG: SGNH hydrolase domain-containing protein [Gordonia sp. (in: high G+C Gram-positive bacteria)]|uniref:SGNH hydrolase domain-containing protein n=1 Tax=Gordonia sp. (in: high G+C Gram-positive bacteria) TaxID=84139 RepID=UPI0039E303EF
MVTRLARTLIGVVAVCGLLASTACQSGGESDQKAVPAAIPQAEVLGAVRAATTLSVLPSSITSARLQAAGKDSGGWAVKDCNPDLGETKLDDLRPCTIGDVDGARTMVLVGDVGAAQWHGAMDLIGKRTGWRVIMLVKNNCGPAAMQYYQWQLKREFRECDAWQKWRTRMIQQEKAEIVVMAGWYGENLGPDRETTPEIWRDALVESVDGYPAAAKIFMFGNPPHPPVDDPVACLEKNRNDLTKCSYPASRVLPDQSGWKSAAKSVGGTYIDVDSWFCHKTCPSVIADRIVYARDKHHIDVDYGRYLSGAIQEVMEPALVG